MRALLVAQIVLTCAIATILAAQADPTATPEPTPSALLWPKPGTAITQTQLLGYLFVAPQPGDWVSYRVSIDQRTLLDKKVGFGTDLLHSVQHAFFETQTQTTGLIAQPVDAHNVAGGSLIWKMFVDAADFNTPGRQYTFVAGVIKIGDASFRLGTGPGQPLSAPSQSVQSLVLYGTLPLPDDRVGFVSASVPQDVTVKGATLHTVHTTVDFAARDIGLANGLPKARVEAWQTTDVPLGIVALRSTTNGHVYRVDLTGFGRDSYRSVITGPFDDIPLFPG